MIELIIPLITSILFVLVLTPSFIKRMHAQGFTGRDMNKYSKPKVAELGGVIVFLGYSLGVLSAIFLSTYLNLFKLNVGLLFAGFCTISLIAFVGLVDDLIGWKKGIKQWQHALFPVLASLPLVVIAAGESVMTFPLIGTIDLGILYPLIIIPIGVTGASNAFNMLAGFNGLEAGQGIILTLTLTIVALTLGQTSAVILGVAMIGALISFLKFNWFPAKIFGGDSLTLMVGANLAVMSIIGNMESIGALVMSLFFVEFLIKAKHKFKSECFGVPKKSGLLQANPKGGSITHFILKQTPMKETELTLAILIMQGLICCIVLGMFFLT